MSYIDYLNDFQNRIYNLTKKYECISDDYAWGTYVPPPEPSGDSGGGGGEGTIEVSYYPSPIHDFLFKETNTSSDEKETHKSFNADETTVYEKLGIVRDQITPVLKEFCTDPWQPDYHDLNYSNISAYASGSTTYQEYDASTQEFIDHPEAYNFKGNLYECYPNGIRGLYIHAYETAMVNIETLFQTLETEYQATPKVPIVPVVGEITTRASKFWTDDRYNSVTSTINSTFVTPLQSIANQFTNFSDVIKGFKSIFNSYSELSSKLYTFMSGYNQLATTDDSTKSMAQVNNDILSVNGFAFFDSGSIMSVAANIVQQARILRDNSKYAEEDAGNDQYFNKIATATMLKTFPPSGFYITYYDSSDQTQKTYTWTTGNNNRFNYFSAIAYTLQQLLNLRKNLNI